MYMCIYIISNYMCIYIYIYISNYHTVEQAPPEQQAAAKMKARTDDVCIHTHIYIYIYM